MIPSDDYLKQRRLYTRSNRGIWRIMAYCDEPTVTMENIVTGERENFGISGATAGTFDPIPDFAWSYELGMAVKAPSVEPER